MKTRSELQREAIGALLDRRRVIVNWGTGVGKSRVAIGCADALSVSGKWRILLLVAETAHKDNWRREFISCLGEERGIELFDSITVECYQSLNKYAWTSWDFIIADEAHHLRSEKRTCCIGTMSAEYFLCLSATMSCAGDADDLLRTLEMSFGEFVNLRFSTQEAFDNKILNEPRIYVHVLSLDDFKIRQDVSDAWGPADRRETIRCDFEDREPFMDRDLNPAVNLVMSATPRQAYDYLSARMASAKRLYRKARERAGLADGQPDNAGTVWAYNMYVQYGSQRKAVLGRSKTVFTKWLLGKLKDRKYVCFCSDVPQALALGGDNVIYAGGPDNGSVIDSFNGDRISSIFAVNMIQEGQNLAGIRAGVIVQLGGKERQFIQKFGRALRSDMPEQHIVLISGTRDEDYYRTAIEGINSKYIRKIYYGTLKDSTGRGNSVDRPGLSRTVSA